MDYLERIKDKHAKLFPPEVRFPFDDYPNITLFSQLPKYYTDPAGILRHTTSGRAVQRRYLANYNPPKLKFASTRELAEFMAECIHFKFEHKCPDVTVK